jgi:hypothetical protein
LVPRAAATAAVCSATAARRISPTAPLQHHTADRLRRRGLRLEARG